MTALLIVYHTRTGGTQQMAETAAAGAVLDAQVSVQLLPAAQARAEDLLAASGFIFATPENLASMAGMMKDFFDRTYYDVLELLAGRPYAAMVCAGSDGHGAARQLERIVTGWRLRAIAPPLIVCTQAQLPAQILATKHLSARDLARCHELGATLAAGLSLGIY